MILTNELESCLLVFCLEFRNHNRHPLPSPLRVVMAPLRILSLTKTMIYYSSDNTIIACSNNYERPFAPCPHAIAFSLRETRSYECYTHLTTSLIRPITL